MPLFLALLASSGAVAAPSPIVAGLDPEVLRRWDVDPAVAATLTDDRIEALKKLESARAADVAVLRRAEPVRWREFVDGKEFLTLEGRRIVSAFLASREARSAKDLPRQNAAALQRARGILDGVWDGEGAGRDAQKSAVVVDARVRNGRLDHLTLTKPGGPWSAEVGQIGLDSRSELISPSWYANLSGDWNSSTALADYRLRSQLGYIGLSSRWFGDAPGLPSPLGQTPFSTYDDPTRTHGLFFGSLLGEASRAYRLGALGGASIDAAWATNILPKFYWVAPNLAADQTAAARVKFRNGTSIGVFGGLAENASPLDSTPFQELAAQGKARTGFQIEKAPHAAIAAWGKLPGTSDVEFQSSLSVRRNALSVSSDGELALSVLLREKPLTVRLTAGREDGQGIDYTRSKLGAQVEVPVSPHFAAYATVRGDDISYGGASVHSNEAMIGLTGTLDGGSRISIDQTFGGREQVADDLRPAFDQTLRDLRANLMQGSRAIEEASRVLSGLRANMGAAELQPRLDALALTLSRLDAGAAAAVIERAAAGGLTAEQQAALASLWLRTTAPNSPTYRAQREMIEAALTSPRARQVFGSLAAAGADWNAHRVDINAAILALTDGRVWNAALVTFARSEMLASLDHLGQIKIPLLGGIPLHIDASAAVAAFAALGSRLSPIAPLTDRQGESWMYTLGARSLGLPPGQATPEGVVNGLLAKADAAIEKDINGRLAPLAAELAKLPPAAAIQRILAVLPPPAADALKALYGPTLAGLIPPDSGKSVASYLDQVVKAATGALEARYGKQIAAHLSSVVSWAGSVVSREINRMVLQMTIAGEQLDALTVDKGRKVDALARESAMEAFNRIDVRRPVGESSLATAVRREAARLAEAEENALLHRLTDEGVAAMSALQRDPTWPIGLRIDVEMQALAPLLASYGDGPLMDAFRRLSEAYQNKHGGVPLTVRVNFDDGTLLSPHGLGIENSTIIRRNGPESIELTLSRPRNDADAESRLEIVATVVR